MTALTIQLTESQAKFVKLRQAFMYTLFCGGYGTGKSYLMGFNAVCDAMHSPFAKVYVLEPFNFQIKEIAVPAVERWLDVFKIKHTPYNSKDHEIRMLDNKTGTIKFLNMDDPGSLVGFEAYTCHIDELDTLPMVKSEEVWDKLIGRARQRPEGVADQYKIWNPKFNRLEHANRMSVYTTPEGFRFCHKMWELNKNDERYKEYAYIQARTMDNTFLSEAYIESLKNKYSGKQLQAYMDGIFVNMESGSVYSAYDQKGCNSFERILPTDILYIGCDFNVNKTCATVYVRRCCCRAL
jgi:hypothetical protein